MKTAEKDSATSKFEVHVSSSDTIGSMKEKVAESQLIAFPEHKLMFNGEKMDESKTLSEYGVKEWAGCFFTFTGSACCWACSADLIRTPDGVVTSVCGG